MPTRKARSGRRLMVRVSEDGGFTLIELSITLMLTVLVLGVLSGLLVSTMRSRDVVDSSSSVVQSAKLFTQSITAGVQNAYALALDPNVTGGQLLRAETLRAKQGSDGSVSSRWVCMAWYWDQADGSVRTATSSTGAVATPTAAQLAGWTLLASGIHGGLGQGGAALVFSVQTTETSLPNATIDFFAAAGSGPAQEYVSTVQALPVPSPSATVPGGTALSCT